MGLIFQVNAALRKLFNELLVYVYISSQSKSLLKHYLIVISCNKSGFSKMIIQRTGGWKIFVLSLMINL